MAQRVQRQQALAGLGRRLLCFAGYFRVSRSLRLLSGLPSNGLQSYAQVWLQRVAACGSAHDLHGSDDGELLCILQFSREGIEQIGW